MDQDGISNHGTPPDSVWTPQNISIGTIEYSLRIDRAVDDRTVDDRAVDDNVINSESDYDTRVLFLLSKDPTTEAKRISEQGPLSLSEMGQREIELPSVTVGSLTRKIRPTTPEVIYISTEEEESDTSNELWLDACQYLADEENEGAILDKCGHSLDVGRTWPRFSADNTKVSDFTCGADTVIGQIGSDLDHLRPPVERWLSADSWSSALSDWAVEEQVPEDFIAAFTPTQTATQGHPQLPMAIQDQMLEPGPSTESPILTGQHCFSTTSPTIPGKLPKEAQFQVRDREDNQTAKLKPSRVETPSVKGDEEPRESQATQDDSFDCPADTLCGTRGSEQYLFCEGAPSDRVFTGNYEAGVEMDTLLLSSEEDSECQYTFLEGDYTFVKKDKTESSTEVLRKETEEGVVTQLASLVEERGAGSYGSAISLSHFPCQEATKVECVCGKAAEQLTELHISTHTQRNTLVTTDLQGKGTHVSLNTSSLQEGNKEGTWGSPHFMIPLAPLSVGSTHRSNSALGGEPACAGGHRGQLTFGSTWSLNEDSLTYSGEKEEYYFNDKTTNAQDLKELGKELSNLIILTSDKLVVSEEDRVACVTLDLQDSLTSSFKPVFKSVMAGNGHCIMDQKMGQKMPHKSAKNTSEMKTRSKKDLCHQLAPQASKKQIIGPNQISSKQQENMGANENQDDSLVTVIETGVITEKVAKAHGKKKKKHSQNAAVKSEAEPLVEVENGAKQKIAKGKNYITEAKASAVSGQSNPTSACQKDNSETAYPERQPQQPAVKYASEGVTNKVVSVGEPLSVTPKVPQNIVLLGQRSDDVIKRRRVSELKLGKHAVESKAQQSAECSVQARGEETKAPVETARKKAYSEVVKKNVHRNIEVPRVVQPIQAGPVDEDPQSLCLWCQFSAVFTDHTVTWTRDGAALAVVHRSAGDESRVSVALSKASNKDLGRYQCCLRCPDGSVSLDYLLTYEVLSEIIIPPQRNIPAAPAEVEEEEEDIKCSRLLFHKDFLCDQHFAEDQSASVVTEKVHFGEGMHRRAFRTKMQAGMVSVFMPGHPCVLKVHNAISYGTKNNEELIQRNYNLAVEECHVQNTAREYIKAYTVVAQSKESFGDVPEIIPIYLVHRPSNDIPYATLEEELRGDFVKYSVRDGKEINLMRRDSEAGQKCCTFQHWVYHKTEGNLLVTDMQGVGMRLTDVGIATCKKGYRGFRGNCATSFIDQFKVLHLCNKYCELLGLKSLQPKPKKVVSAPKPKAHPAPKKKTFGPTVKGKL
ncbi:alpha-protein kinase 2 isoform X3 [Hypomesus transpacificus]|uniref:alpha-protein kinase 2 isoform X3 n=1 Tax=Hypomesus transpacificus TaxID=137520 RepID=UPI001F086F6D|nr:alpha-protein kinase 2 isoform X3 [Hypomesus transpacificus]